jgi:hypothetical protein
VRSVPAPVTPQHSQRGRKDTQKPPPPLGSIILMIFGCCPLSLSYKLTRHAPSHQLRQHVLMIPFSYNFPLVALGTTLRQKGRFVEKEIVLSFRRPWSAHQSLTSLAIPASVRISLALHGANVKCRCDAMDGVTTFSAQGPSSCQNFIFIF